MSVIQSIRDRGTWIIFVIIALALIAFILQDGAQRGGSAFSNSSVITKVNGVEIQRGDFEDKLKNAEAMYASQGATREQLIGNVWNQEVEKVLLEQEFDKLGITVSPKELNDILFGQNSPLRQEFTDPNTGEFRVDDAKRAFAQIKKSKNAEQIKMITTGYIDPAIENGKRNKYQNLLIQSAYIPKWLVDKQSADNSSMASISYVYIPYGAIADTLAKVSDDDISSYVKKHAVEFEKTEETRNISFVSFYAGPSSTDSINALNQLMELSTEFQSTSDAKAYLAKVGTELAFYDSYFGKNKMQMSLKDSIVKTPVGKVFGPYIDGNNYVLAKMVGIKQWADSASVRHILIATVDPRSGQEIRPDSVGKSLADSIDRAIKSGADFNTLVAKYSDDQASKAKGGVYEYFPQGQMVIPFNDYAFDNAVGSKGVVKTDFGYHVVEVIGHKNVSPAYKIAYLAKPILPSNETISLASNTAAQFVAESKNAKTFNEQAKIKNLPILTASDIKANDFTINTIGSSRSLVRWIYEKSEGDVSEPTEIDDQIVVAYISAINKPGLLSAAEARPTVEGIVRNEKKAKIIIDTKIKGSSLNEIASSTGFSVGRLDSLSFGNNFITGLGSEPKIIGASFNKSISTNSSSPIAGSNGVFAIQTIAVSAVPSAFNNAALSESLLQSRKMSIYRSAESLRKSATIKDLRSTFY